MSSHDIATAFNQISGVPVTAFDADGNVDPRRSGEIASRIARAGVRNVIAAGNTGEFFSLSLAEIRTLHVNVAEAVGRDSLVTASVGRSLVEAKQLAKAAADDGADTVMAHWPTDPFAGPQQKVDYFIDLAEASPLPVVAYIRSDELGLTDLERLSAHDNVVAIKYAATNMMQLADAVRTTANHDTIWVCGLAEGWAPPFYALGARGFTSGLVNVFPKLSIAISNALNAADYVAARELINQIAGFERLRTLYNNGANVTVVKEALDILGEPYGPVRLPGVRRLSPSERAQLSNIIETLNNSDLVQ